MAEQFRTQLFMMLVQEAGPGFLPLTHLPQTELLNFLEKVQETLITKKLTPIMAYWSSHDAKLLLPEGIVYKQLVHSAFCLSTFSEMRPDKQDEFGLLVESQELCLVLYGHSSHDTNNHSTFQCVGSLDPRIVRRAFQIMLPVWQFINLPEANRLEDARNNMGTPNSSPNYVQYLRTEWPIVKMATAMSNMEQIDSGQWQVPANPLNYLKPSLPQPSQKSVNPLASQLIRTPADQTTHLLNQSGSALPPVAKPKKRDSKGIKGLRAVWTTIAEETRSIFPPDAQKIIRDIIGQLRHSSDLSAILQLAIQELTRVGQADRGLIWQVVGDQLTVTGEHATNGHTCFVGTNLSSHESTAIVLEFLSRFPDESGTGVIAIADTSQDTKLHKVSPTLASLIELGEVRARLVAQLRCRGIFSGFLELQQKEARDWSEQDAAILQSVAEVLSFVVQQAFDLSKIETDAQEMKLINEISALFRESKGQRSQDTLAKSVKLVATHMGFLHAQIYLFNEEEGLLISQIADGQHYTTVSLSAKDNPFVSVFESGRGKVINAEYTRKGDPFFNHDTALIVPLISEGERLGVFGLWQREKSSPQFRAQDRELALTIAGNLSSIIRADQAIAQIRADRARERLINSVSNEIRQSLKEVDQILETLVNALKDNLVLGLCEVSLFDNSTGEFTKSKIAGSVHFPDISLPAGFCSYLFTSLIEHLKKGQIIILSTNDINEKLSELGLPPSISLKLITVVPLMQGQEFKGALCMVSCDRQQPFSVKDMNMIEDLADRVAVVVSHKELFEQVERQAVTDPMTGLFNRRYFQEQLSKEIDRHQRFGHAFSYIILDLDYLKKINDSLGHQYGDAAIRHIASVLKKSVRDVDTTARYGGEEFVVLLPETEVLGARIVAERMCASIREKEVEGIGVVTASIGVATFPQDADDRDKLIELADQALYLAKHRGRNQVCSVSEDLMPSLIQRGEEALEIQKATIKAKVEELGSIDLKLITEHGLLGILGVIVKMIETKDAYTKERSPRAAEYASKIAQALHLSKDHTTVISLAAILNNVGKIAVDEDILQKKGPLTEAERKIIQATPAIGARILEPSRHIYRVASVIEACHEHWDGSGYPKGLKGEDIPLESRIIALIDSFIAMTSDRPYRAALSVDEALATIQQGAGKQWDPRLVRIFLSLIRKERSALKAKTS